MIQAAIFLITRGVKNRVVRTLSRLRQPRYAAGAVLVVLYFWTVFFRRHTRVAASHVSQIVAADLFIVILTVLALVIIVGAWALPNESPAFVFSEAEIQFLFPAPLSRRQLLGYKVMQSQVGLLFTAAVMWLFAFRGSHYLGMWLAIAAMNVYTMFVSFARARLKLAGIGFLTRLAAVLVVTIAIFGIASWQLRDIAPAMLNALSANKLNAVGTLMRGAVTRAPLGIILAAPRIFAEVIYAPASPALFVDAAIVLVSAIVLFLAAVRLNVSFEDASIVASQRALTRRGRMRSMRMGNPTAVHRFPPPFQLRENGRPEVAVLWKNLIASMRVSGFLFAALIVPVAFIATASIFHNVAVEQAIGVAAMLTTLIFVFAGPQVVRGDLRLDLLRLDVVKSFPISAEMLVAAELAAPLLIVSIFELLMLSIGFIMLTLAGQQSFLTSPEFMVSAIVFVIPVSAIQLLIQNAAMVLFPAWSVSMDSARGLTALGQRMLLLIGNIMTLAVALLPAALVLAGSVFAATKVFGSSPAVILIATLPAAALLVGEVAIGHRMLASQFEEIDIANDLENATP
ncbi:MAG TPA: putative ABC exporter domain-containing protein [Thermoanaerobaculia bacterium]|nr:putative ABC exporter domain-containing protein [Thermoanaerobaculia bacterium]